VTELTGALSRHPMMAARSVFLSMRHRPAGVRFPLRATRAVTIQCEKGSKLELGGPLFLGFAPIMHRELGTEGLSPRGWGKTVLRLGPRATLRTKGWVILEEGAQVVIGADGEVELGGRNHLSTNAQILCREKIVLDRDAGMAPSALLMDSDHHAVAVESIERPETEAIHLGENVWIAIRAIVLKGVHVGDGAIVGAGAIVTKDVPARSLVAGVPAKVIRENVHWTRSWREE
jgi:tetrahydrodipicolinate N-acetyltransferase